MLPRPFILWMSLLATALCAVAPSTYAQAPSLPFGGEIPVEVDTIYDRGIGYLTKIQNDDGSWHGASGNGITGLCLMAFLASGEDPNFGPHHPQIAAALRSLIQSQEKDSGYIPDSMYHHGFAMLALAEAYGAVDEDLIWNGSEPEGTRRSIAIALEKAISLAVTAQKANRWGGWRYSPTSTDADTSVTGCVLMGLLACRNAGLSVPDETLNSAIVYMQRNTASSGFVAYAGGIGGAGESSARSAVATLVYAVSHHRDTDEYRAALQHIVQRIDHVETAHPQYYIYYMAQALFQADPVRWSQWNRTQAATLASEQAPDGSFPGSYGEAYCTAMSLLSLALNYRYLPIYERF